MALSFRVLSRSQQFHAAPALLLNANAISHRTYAKEVASAPTKMDGMLKGIFDDVKKKFAVAYDVLKREKITMDPDDPQAVAHFAKVLRTIRKEAGLLTDVEKLRQENQRRTMGIPDARTYFLTLQEIRIEFGLIDNFGAEKMTFEAIDKVEKEIGQPLLRSDKKGMALLQAEFVKINQKIGLRDEDIPKLEQKIEMEFAKDRLADMKKQAVSAMETQLKREEFKDETMPDVRSLDIRDVM